MNPPVITFIGWHNCGKTTLASQVVRHLKKRGYRVAVVKSTKEEGLYAEEQGTDTHIYQQAGADAVLLATPKQIIFQSKEKDLSAIARRFLYDFDLVIGEGFKDSPQIFKIEVFRGQGPLLYPSRSEVIAVVTDQTFTSDKPLFALDDSSRLADFIEEHCLRSRAGEEEFPSKDSL
jgi:molybdopterin-guanine dinucleotide biosynthesis adapter protein